jgi:hypothetical protein
MPNSGMPTPSVSDPRKISGSRTRLSLVWIILASPTAGAGDSRACCSELVVLRQTVRRPGPETVPLPESGGPGADGNSSNASEVVFAVAALPKGCWIYHCRTSGQSS